MSWNYDSWERDAEKNGWDVTLDGTSAGTDSNKESRGASTTWQSRDKTEQEGWCDDGRWQKRAKKEEAPQAAKEESAQEILEKLGLVAKGEKPKFTKELRAAVKEYKLAAGKAGKGLVSKVAKADAKVKAEAKDKKFRHKESCYPGKGVVGDWHQ